MDHTGQGEGADRQRFLSGGGEDQGVILPSGDETVGQGDLGRGSTGEAQGQDGLQMDGGAGPVPAAQGVQQLAQGADGQGAGGLGQSGGGDRQALSLFDSPVRDGPGLIGQIVLVRPEAGGQIGNAGGEAGKQAL